MNTPDSIWIESTRDRDKLGSACLITWGAGQWYAPVDKVRRTAEDLFTCAAYADLIGELMRAGIPADIVTGLTTAMLADRRPRYFGDPETIYILPGGFIRPEGRRGHAVPTQRLPQRRRAGRSGPGRGEGDWAAAGSRPLRHPSPTRCSPRCWNGPGG